MIAAAPFTTTLLEHTSFVGESAASAFFSTSTAAKITEPEQLLVQDAQCKAVIQGLLNRQPKKRLGAGEGLSLTQRAVA